MYKTRIIKQDINELPFEYINNDREAAESLQPEEFIKRYQLKTSWSWLGPQLLAHLGSYTLPEKNEQGKYDGEEFMFKNLNKNSREQGLWRLLNETTRSGLMRDSQTSKIGLPVCSLVPLYLAAQKMFNKVKYSSWVNIKHVVDPKLYEAITILGECSIPNIDRLIEIRQIACNGVSPSKTYRLIDVQSTELANLSIFTKHMLLQTWVAHPTNRHEYMILDPCNWDSMPKPLLSTDIMITQDIPTTANDLPWTVLQKNPLFMHEKFELKNLILKK